MHSKSRIKVHIQWCIAKVMVFPVVMYVYKCELDHKESRGTKESMLLDCGAGGDS